MADTAFQLEDTSTPVVFPRVCDRLFPLGQYNWRMVAGPGTPVYSAELPQAWLSIPRIVSAVQGFKYFRCDGFKMTITVSGQPMLYGSLIASVVPYGIATDDVAYSSLRSASMFPNTVVTNGSANNVEIFIPWIYPFQYFDLEAFYDDAALPDESHIGALMIRVLNSLTAQTVDPGADAEVSIFVQAVKPEFFGWNGRDYEQPTMVAESALPPPNAEGSAMSGAQDQASTPNLATQALKVVTKPLGGVLDTVTGAVDTVTDALGPIGDVISDAFGFLGLEKPLDPEAPARVNLNYGPGLTNADTLYQGTSLSYCQNARLDSSAKIAGLDDQTMLLSAFAGTPSFLGTWEMKGTSPAFIIPTHPSYVPETTTPYVRTFAGAAAAPFVFVRTSMNYLIQVVSGPFQAGMLRVAWVAGPPDQYSTNTDIDQTMSRFVRLNGDARLKFSTPYISQLPFMRSCGGAPGASTREQIQNEPCGYLHFSWQNPVVNPDPTLDNPVYINIFAAAAEDFVGYRFVGGVSTASDLNDMEAEMDTRGEFNEMFPPFHDTFKSVTPSGLYMGADSNATIKDLLLPTQYLGEAEAINGYRISFQPTLATASFVLQDFISAPLPDQLGPLDYFKRYFAFWRGGFRVFTALNVGTQVNAVSDLLLHVTYDNGTTGSSAPTVYAPREFTHTKYNPSLLTQVGYMSGLTFQSTRLLNRSGYNSTAKYTISPSNEHLRLGIGCSVADDFQLMMPVPAPPYY